MVRGTTRSQKVISLPSQAVSMFVRTSRNRHLIQGPPGPDLSHSLRLGRRLFPSTTPEETRSPTPVDWAEEGPIAERLSNESSTPAPRRSQADVQLLEAEPAMAPVDTHPGIIPTPATVPNGSERPRKRRKTAHTGDQEIPRGNSQIPLGGHPSAAVPTKPDSERKAFIKKFGAEKGLTAPVLEALWQSRKHRYHKPYDAPFAKFRAFFDETRPLCPFRPDTI